MPLDISFSGFWTRLVLAGLFLLAAVGTEAVPILNPDNGHYYEAVVFDDENDFLTWDAAKLSAEERTFMGRSGHLATITTKTENDFLILHFAPLRSPRGELWVGGSDAPVDGEWRWVVGPEAGTLFWLGNSSGVAILFAAWAPGEPNNAFGPGSESRLGWSELGWNDLPAFGFASVRPGYIVEFSTLPEPGMLGFLALAIVGIASMRRRNRHRPISRPQPTKPW